MCAMYSVQCVVYSIQCVVYSIQCVVYSAVCAVCTVCSADEAHTVRGSYMKVNIFGKKITAHIKLNKSFAASFVKLYFSNYIIFL